MTTTKAEVKIDIKTDGKAQPDSPKADSAKPAAAKPSEPPFHFFHQLQKIHASVVALPGYPIFFLKYLTLQLIRLATNLSFLIAIYAMRDHLTFDKLHNFDLSTGQIVTLACLAVLNIFGRLTPFLNKLTINQFKEQLQIAQATACFAKIFELPHNSVISTPSGEFMQLLLKVFRALDPLLPGLYGAVLPVYVETVVAVVIIGVLYGPIALLLLVLVGAYSIVSYQAAHMKAENAKEQMKTGMAEFGKILAGAGSYERAHFFGNVAFEVQQTKGSFERVSHLQLHGMQSELKEAMKMHFITLVVMGVTVALVILAVDRPSLELFNLIGYFGLFSFQLAELANGIANLRTALVEYQSFDDYLHRLSEVADAPDAEELPPDNPTPSIEFQNVSFSYGGRVILDDVSFKVEGGHTLGLVGSSGCGKSTIMRLLLRFYRPSAGTILVDGRDIQSVTGASLRRIFSIVTQDAALFSDSIRNNIAYAKMGASDEELLGAAKLAELNLHDGDLSLDKECGEKGAKLSGGQQQRVALARAMLKNGTIYLLDEPTTGLDGVVSKQIQKTLDALSERVTTVCITHHLDDLKQAQQILYLDKGTIIERGTFESLMADEGEFYRQVEARKKGNEES